MGWPYFWYYLVRTYSDQILSTRKEVMTLNNIPHPLPPPQQKQRQHTCDNGRAVRGGSDLLRHRYVDDVGRPLPTFRLFSLSLYISLHYSPSVTTNTAQHVFMPLIDSISRRFSRTNSFDTILAVEENL